MCLGLSLLMEIINFIRVLDVLFYKSETEENYKLSYVYVKVNYFTSVGNHNRGEKSNISRGEKWLNFILK